MKEKENKNLEEFTEESIIIKPDNEGPTWEVVPFILVLCFLLVMIGFMGDLRGKSSLERETEHSMVSIQKQETEMSEIFSSEKLEEQMTETTFNEPETENWKDTIFGQGKEFSIFSPLVISGLSANEKVKLGFRESDFVKAASVFLKSQEMECRAITFEEEVSVSSTKCVSYMAALDKDEKLLVLFYPDYPGEYVFLLLDELPIIQKDDVETTVTAPTIIETQPVDTIKETERNYDATRLSVLGIPEPLLNYINNRYELQYELYDHLYHNGWKKVDSATVSDYFIDGDTRSATIQFKLSNGSTVNGTYYKDKNIYYFD